MCTACGLCAELLTEDLSEVVTLSNKRRTQTVCSQILDTCENNFWPKCVADLAQSISTKILQLVPSMKLSESSLTVFTLYVSFIKLDIPRLAESVENRTYVKPGTINRVGGLLKPQAALCEKLKDRQWLTDLVVLAGVPIEHHHLTQLYCVRLHIPFKHISRIQRMVQNLAQTSLVGMQARTTNAVAIYLYCREMNVNNVGLTAISIVCNRMQSTILRNLAKVDSVKISELLMYTNKSACI